MDINIKNDIKDALIQIVIKYDSPLDKDVLDKKVDLIITNVLDQFSKEFNDLFDSDIE